MAPNFNRPTAFILRPWVIAVSAGLALAGIAQIVIANIDITSAMALDDTWFWFILGIFYLIGAVAGFIAASRMSIRPARFFYRYCLFWLLPVSFIMLIVYPITTSQKNLPALCNENNEHYAGSSQPVGYECHRIREFIIAATCAVCAIVLFFVPVVTVLSRYFYYALVLAQNNNIVIANNVNKPVVAEPVVPIGHANV